MIHIEAYGNVFALCDHYYQIEINKLLAHIKYHNILRMDLWNQFFRYFEVILEST